MKLHIGCGKRNFGVEWTHIDKGNYPHLHSHDITKLPFHDNTVYLIYASHVLAYFDRDEVIQILTEWNRVLCRNGTLRIAIPDFEALTKLYNDSWDLAYLLGPLYGKMQIDDQVIYHKTAYDYKHLCRLLAKTGFKNIHKYDCWDTEHKQQDDHSKAYLPDMDQQGTLISLNVECVKS
jgi:ubiquinone/menaquinone biosynthesis C-methylase UbiE